MQGDERLVHVAATAARVLKTAGHRDRPLERLVGRGRRLVAVDRIHVDVFGVVAEHTHRHGREVIELHGEAPGVRHIGALLDERGVGVEPVLPVHPDAGPTEGQREVHRPVRLDRRLVTVEAPSAAGAAKVGAVHPHAELRRDSSLLIVAPGLLAHELGLGERAVRELITRRTSSVSSVHSSAAASKETVASPDATVSLPYAGVPIRAVATAATMAPMAMAPRSRAFVLRMLPSLVFE